MPAFRRPCGKLLSALSFVIRARVVYNGKVKIMDSVLKGAFSVYEISSGDAGRFESEKAARRIYRDGVYAFTFEHAWLVYYCRRAAGSDTYVYEYIAVDAVTGCGSHVCYRDEVVPVSASDVLVPDILNAVKYTGDRRIAS